MLKTNDIIIINRIRTQEWNRKMELTGKKTLDFVFLDE